MRPGVGVSCRRSFSAGGTGKSGAKPARSRHCERALRRSRGHWGVDGSPGRRDVEPQARRPDSGRGQHDPRGKGGSMTDRIRGAAPVAALLLLLAAAPAADALPVTVNLRVEGLNRTVFDGPVTTDAHVVTTTAAGPHTCDGTNGAAEPEPGPTATGALDDAAKLAGFTIDGPYGNFGIDDYFLERVADEQVDPSSEYWSLWINHQFSDKGGCQKRVLAGQDVLWAGIPFSVSIPLKLTGPESAVTGQPVQVEVTDGSNGDPQEGATVAGATTGADGRAMLAFPDEGIY